MRSDPLKSSLTAYGILEEKQYKAEQSLAEKYQAFTAEILRVSLLGLAAFGFLYKEAFATFDPRTHPGVDIAFAKTLAVGSIYFFGISALFALVFQYFSSESFRTYLEGLRFHLASQADRSDERLATRSKVVIVCMLAKAVAAASLAVASLLTALAFGALLK
jgi:hypothetical protein